ncbi:MAG TPA: iron chelate uptake ABC transporter family permease subunit [Ignavibacteria bacterium]|nr:iron chelate uptake ABC transporter family permease subunit [Ignavibacteria bacterium]
MDFLTKYLLDPLSYEFIQRALIASVTIGISCGLIGTYIMLRRMSLIGDALAHAVLPGVVVSFMVAGKSEVALFVGAVVSGILTVLLIGFVNRNSKIKEDTSIGIIFTGAFALGILLVSQLKQVHIDLSSYLFGDVLGVSTGDITLSMIIMAVIILCIVLFYKQLLLTSFDPTMAMTIGISTTLVHYMLMTLLSMSIVAGLQSVGVILIIAMLITPPATAYLLSNNLKKILLLSAAFGTISAVTGLYLSYHFNFASGASIVLVAVALFMLAFLFSPKEGVVTKLIRRRSASKLVLIEDVIKLSYRFKDEPGKTELVDKIANELGISNGRVESAIKTLIGKELMSRTNGTYNLTDEGVKYALRLVRTHRLWETYITNKNVVDIEHIHPEAEKVEHVLTEDMVDELDEELGFPEKDPHGSEIPRK